MNLISTLLKDADEAVLRGDIEAASRLYSHVRDQEPGNADAWNGMAAVHFERGQLAESLAAFRKARALATDGAAKSYPANKALLRAVKGIALNLYRMEQPTEAMAALDELAQLDPDDHMGASFLIDDIKKGKKLWKK